MIGTHRRPAPSGLTRTRTLLDPALRAAVEWLPELIRLPVSYHFGWTGPDGTPGSGDGGKALRPAIAMLAAEAVGGRPEQALPGAVAIELVHNFSLLHDDVIDGDRERRHRPTVWALFGVGQAIVAGDALATLAVERLLEAGRPDAVRELTASTANMILGQAEDLAFESRLDVTTGECLAMSAHKTSALLSCAAVLGALLGDGADSQVEALRRFGRELGIAFQAVDDLLGIWGDPSSTGKPVATDLRQHKKTVPVVHALGLPEGDALRSVLSNGEVTDDGVAAAMAALEACGSRAWTAALAERHLALALDALTSASLEPGPAGELREISMFVTGRDF